MKYLMISVKLALLLTTATGWTQQQPAEAYAALPPTTPPIELEYRVLTGRVTDPFAYPLTGAIIMLRSPGKGFSPDAFSTNAEGHYMVTAKQTIPRNTIIPRNTVMEVKAAGYAPLELLLTNCQPLDLTLMPLTNSYSKPMRAKKLRGNGKVR